MTDRAECADAVGQGVRCRCERFHTDTIAGTLVWERDS